MEPNEIPSDTEALRESVREAYSDAATHPQGKHHFPVGTAFALSVGYPQEWLDRLPAEASEAFAGVSNVSLRAPIPEGALVVDLGCGAGLDTIVAAHRVGTPGRVIGVDFSAPMLQRARCAARRSGVHNIDLVAAAAEAVPFSDASADFVIVNGIFNLNPRRREIFAQLARILKPQGQVFGAELVLHATLPDSLQAGSANWFS